MDAPLNLEAFRDAARRRLPRALFEYVDCAAQDGLSLRANRASFERVAFAPRTLVDVTTVDTDVTVLDEAWRQPFGIAPMGAAALVADRADIVLATEAANAGIPFVLSASSLTRVEAVMRANPRAWFQAYLSTDRAIDEALLERVGTAGVRTLVVTVDVPVGGKREADLRNGYTSPMRPDARFLLDAALHPRWLLGTLARTLVRDGMPHFENATTGRVPMIGRQPARVHRREAMNWETVGRVRSRWPFRLVLKGILAADDARRAREAGADAVIASNHGGRQLDGAVAPLDVLPELVEAAQAMPVLLDSGVRRGGDVIKAAALGAPLAFVGRPFLYACATGGADGVRRAIAILADELARDLRLLGCRRPGEARPRLRHPGGPDLSSR